MENKFEKLDKNLLRLLAIDLDIPSLIKFCKTNKRINKEVCESKDFWRNKLHKEFPNTIGKFSKDFKRIYFSLLNKEVIKYYIFISAQNEEYGNIPKIYDYIKRTPLTEEDYEMVEKLYPDFSERMGEGQSFTVIGDFPAGTKIWLAYIDDRDFGVSEGFLTRKEAIDLLLKISNYVVENDFELARELEEEVNMTPEKFHGDKLDNLKQRNREILNKTGHLKIKGHDDRLRTPIFPINFIVKEVELVDYGKMVEELKKKNPDWRKLPKDMINYILNFLDKK
jgi:hypothetical protein